MRPSCPPPLLAVLILALATPCWAQTAADLRVPTADELVREGDELHLALRPMDALGLYRAAVAVDQTHYGALWKGAREAVTLGMLASEQDAAEEWFVMAEGFARGAIATRPDAAAGHEWLAITLGRRALLEGPARRTELAVEVREEALAALAVDSLSARAPHVLGRWHGEVRSLSGVTRFLARKLMGADVLGKASWEAAEYHLRRAIELEPDVLIHHLELARVLAETGHPQEAREHLRRVMELPATEPADPLHKQAAQELLREID